MRRKITPPPAVVFERRLGDRLATVSLESVEGSLTLTDHGDAKPVFVHLPSEAITVLDV